MRNRKKDVQARVFDDNDNCIIIEGVSEITPYTYEYWGFQESAIEEHTTWHLAYNEETNEEIEITEELEKLAEETEIEII